MEKLAKIATEKGYSPEFVAFAQKCENPWNEGSAIDAVQAGKTEREVIEIILCPLTEGVFFSQKEREEYINECIQAGKDEYIARCDKNGNFMY